MNNSIKFKLSETTGKGNGDISTFSLSYSGKKMDNAEASYQIISALKAETYLFIELNSSLVNMKANDKMNLAAIFMENLQSLGIQYISKKFMEDEKRKIFSISIDSKKVEGFEIYALIPNEIWCEQEYKKIIPQTGVRYYLPYENTESNLTAFVDLDEEERLRLSKLVIFDYILLASMGINTTHLAKNDIERLLK